MKHDRAAFWGKTCGPQNPESPGPYLGGQYLHISTVINIYGAGERRVTESCFLVGCVKQIELRRVGRDVTRAWLDAATANYDRTFPVGPTTPDPIELGSTGDVTQSQQLGWVGLFWAKSGLCDISFRFTLVLQVPCLCMYMYTGKPWQWYNALNEPGCWTQLMRN